MNTKKTSLFLVLVALIIGIAQFSSGIESTGNANFTVTKTTLSSTFYVNDTIEYLINFTNNGTDNITILNINDTFDSSKLNISSANITINSNNTGWVYFENVTGSTPLQQTESFVILVNMTVLDSGTNVWNNITINATDNSSNKGTAITGVSITTTVNDTTNPIVSLQTPANASTTTSNNVTFNASVTDNSNLENCSLYTNTSGTWGFNESTNVLVTSNTSSFTFNSLADGIYMWNVQCCDNNTNCAFNATNYTVTVNYTGSDVSAPTFDHNLSNFTIEYGTALNYDINASDNRGVANFAVNNSYFQINTSGNLENKSTPLGTYSLLITINDSAGNENTSTMQVILEDTTPPYFSSLPGNQVINTTQNFVLQINGADNNNVSGYSVNNTAKFSINSSGHLINATQLTTQTFSLNVTVNDSSGNVNSTTFNVTVQEYQSGSVTANTSAQFNFTDSNTTIILYLNNTVSTTITVNSTDANPNGTAAGLLELKSIDISVDTETSNNLTWAYIRVDYNQTEVSNAGIEESSLKMYYYNTSAGDWLLEPTQGLDTTNNYVWANMTHFSLFSLLGSAPSTSSPDGSTSGSSWDRTTYDDNETCQESWICETWGDCIEGIQTRKCYEANACGTELYKPSETKDCGEVVEEDTDEEETIETIDEGGEDVEEEEEETKKPFAIFGIIGIAVLIIAALIISQLKK